MPFDDVVFWIFLTIFGTGLYWLVERKRWGIILTIVGLIGIGYSIRAHLATITVANHGNWPVIPVAFLLCTWIALGFDYYDRHRRRRTASDAIPPGEHPIPIPKVKTIEEWPYVRLELVLNQTFTDQEVPLDGRNYIKCAFKNVSFVYDGTAPLALTECSIDNAPLPRLETRNPAIQQWSQIMRALGIIKPDAGIQHRPLPPAPK